MRPCKCLSIGGLVCVELPLPMLQRPPKEGIEQGSQRSLGVGISERGASRKMDEKVNKLQAEICRCMILYILMSSHAIPPVYESLEQ